MKPQRHFRHIFFLVLAVLMVLLMTLGPNPGNNPKKIRQVKLIPFHHVSTLIRLAAKTDLPLAKIRSNLVDLFGNIALFMPFGAASSLLLGWQKRPARSRLLIIFGIGLCFSLLIETVQLWLPGRVPDIDDVIFNSSGSFLGATLISLRHSGYNRIYALLTSRRVRRSSPITQPF